MAMGSWLHELEALHEQVAQLMTDETHTVEIREDCWAVQHPLRCRPDMLSCPVSRIMTYGLLVRDEDGEFSVPVQDRCAPGRYVVSWVAPEPHWDTGWTFVRLEGEPVDPVIKGLEDLLRSIEGLVDRAEAEER